MTFPSRDVYRNDINNGYNTDSRNNAARERKREREWPVKEITYAKSTIRIAGSIDSTTQGRIESWMNRVLQALRCIVV